MKTPELDSSPAMQRILGVLQKKSNMSITDISAEAFVGISTLACGGYIAALKKGRRIYISGWRKIKSRFSTPLYSLGSLNDVQRPRVDECNREAPGMQSILATLERCGSLTYREIAGLSGLSLNTVKNSGYLDALIAQGRIHVGGWRRSSHGPMSPLYAYGPGEAVPRTQSLTGAQKCSRHRARIRIVARGVGLSSQILSLSASIRNNAVD
jgi:hypothetical protein